ncbi:transmembrane protein 154 isoform X2 [Boleophthalmus pectinirostris]|uniref:transmembrane protein 154 isoform X2 n=1 Tax=Boleophthalmus pectinirostris TaxID=150288 RepID=UPI000A1C2A3C|nr:transmembrane protein 154 isoform X2 [Boleophthalmus pectinirostris]
MSVRWAGNMRGPPVQMHVSGWLLLLLLLLSGVSRTVLCQEEDPDPDAELQDSEDAVVEEVAAVEESADPLGNDSGTTPVPEATDPKDTEEEEGVNEDDHGSGRSLGNAPPESTLQPTIDTGTTPSPEDDGTDLLLIIIPVVLVILFLAIIVCCILINRKLNNNTTHSEVSKEDPYLDDSSREKVPMPMFEEDVPSVLELEMEELDDWIKKDGQLSIHNQIA